MPKPYSYDIRQKVIQAIRLDGLKIYEASILFSISCNTISLWLKRQAFVAELATIPWEQIVYLDESGMDNPYIYHHTPQI